MLYLNNIFKFETLLNSLTKPFPSQIILKLCKIYNPKNLLFCTIYMHVT